MMKNLKFNMHNLIIMTFIIFLLLSGCSKKDDQQSEENETVPDSQEVIEDDTKEEEVIEEVDVVEKGNNPLTGLVMDQKAEGKRPVAVMVENSGQARPQWGMDDPDYAPDIILEAEVEYGITRTMWLFADYNALPEIVGPVRSARPPYVLFSQLFDAIYVHWGQSETLAPYVGADDIIAARAVNNINQMEYRGKTQLFDRSTERKVALEHTGIIYGDKLPDAIAEYGYRTDLNTKKFESLEFNDSNTKMSDTACNNLKIYISGRSWIKNWTYNPTDHLYHTDDFKNNLTRKNILILMDETEYVRKPGASFEYCNYSFTRGEGKLASLGTIMDIEWSVEKGKLVIQDKSGKNVKFNRGKTYIAWISSNNGGKIEIQ